jgi:hypothetical protein
MLIIHQRCEIRLGRGEISPGCRYADPDNVDWSGWMRVAPTTPDRLAIAGDQQRRATFLIQTARQAMVEPFPSRPTSATTCCIPDARRDESDYLNAFDSNHGLIFAAAANDYVRGGRFSRH